MFSLKNNWNWVSWSVVVSLMLFAGCSGQAVSPLGDEADYDEIGDATAFMEDGSITMDAPPSPRQASAPGDDLISDELEEVFDWMTYYMAHIPLATGENEVDVTKFLYHSANAFVDHDDIYLNHVDLNSEPGGISYVTYGFRDIPAGENITRVEVWGDGIFGDGDENGLYIGIGDPDADTYKWIGPFKSGEEWAFNAWFMDNVNDLQRAYLTFVVSNGDMAEIRELRVYVDGMPEIGFEVEGLLERVAFDSPLPDPETVGPPHGWDGPWPDPAPGV